MLHKDVSGISYKHYYNVHNVIKKTMGYDLIQHFSLNLVRPDGEMLFLSGTPSHAHEICSRGLGEFDGIISENNYTNYEFYWWKDAAHKAYADDIEYIRNKVLYLHDGFMLVRKFDDFYLIYSYAFRKEINDANSLVVNNINNFLKMGDDAYMLLREQYEQYCDKYTPPVIKQFYPFLGGKPINRKTVKTTSSEHSNIILFPQNWK